jgi:hypothetical protein
MSNQTSPTGLLKLPQELRDQIYGYVMLKQKATVTMLAHYNTFQSPISAAQPALCCVNKQIRTETLPIFYNSNLFFAEVSDADDLAIAKNWLSAIGDENIRHIHRLSLCGWTRVMFGHMICRLWIRVVMNLKNGTLEVEGNETQVDRRHESYVVKDMNGLKNAYWQMIDIKDGEAFDVESLGSLMDGFHALCLS